MWGLNYFLGFFSSENLPQIATIAVSNFDWRKLIDLRVYLVIMFGSLAALGLIFIVIVNGRHRESVKNNPNELERAFRIADFFMDEFSSLNINFGSVFFLVALLGFQGTNDYYLYSLLTYALAWVFFVNNSKSDLWD